VREGPVQYRERSGATSWSKLFRALGAYDLAHFGDQFAEQTISNLPPRSA